MAAQALKNQTKLPANPTKGKKKIWSNARVILFTVIFFVSVSLTGAYTTSLSHRSLLPKTCCGVSQGAHVTSTTALSAIPHPSEWGDNSNNNGDFSAVDADTSLLYERLNRMRAAVLEQEMDRPPNSSLGPAAFVRQVLQALRNPDEPLPDSGFRLLLRASSKEWRRLLLQSVDAPDSADEAQVASALGNAMSRPNNKFSILVDTDDDYDGDEDQHQTRKCRVSIFEPLDFMDGTCWLTCQLRGRDDGKLLVTMGWQLIRRPEDGAWVIDNIDWQDYRDAFQPGISEEERFQMHKL